MAIANRRFVVQIVQVVEDRWLSRGVKGPVRTERHYSIDAIPLSAPDAETAYERAMEWIRSGRFEDTNHDHLGNETGYFALGIHDLVEVSPDGGWDKLDLPIFSLSAVDAKGVPFIQQREHLAVFRDQCWKSGAAPERPAVTLEKFMGAPIDAARPSAEFLEASQAIYPPSLVELWREHGFAGYERGLFWMTNPEELSYLVSLFGMMLAGDRRRDIIARDAFANLYVLVDGERVKRFCPHTDKWDPFGSIEWFLQLHVTYPRSQRNYLWRDIFEPALVTHGQLTAGECYGFVPLIPRGGKRAAPFLRRLPFRKYLELLAATWASFWKEE